MTQQICAGEAYFVQPDELPLYAGQEGLLLHWQMNPQSPAYNLPFPLVVDGEIEMARLRLAISEVGRRYPYLRARIRVGAEGPRLTWAQALPIPVIERRVEEPLDVAIRKAASVPFDLQSGPLMRVELLRGSTETVLLLLVHHIVFDGVSGPILFSALSRAYAGESLGRPEEELARIAGFVERQRALCEGPEGKARRAFWQGYLGNDVPAIALPASVDGRERGGHLRIVPLDPALSKRVDQCASELNKSRFSLFFGAFYVLMHGYTGQEDLLVSTPFHGRRDRAIQDCIGNFANVLPIRRRLRGTDDYAAVVQGLSVDLRACLRHGDFPFPNIREAAGFVGEAGRSRIQRAMFVLQKFDTWKDGRNQDVSVQSIPFRGGRRDCTLRLIDVVQEIDYALNVFMREDSGGVSFAWKDATGEIGPTRLDEMAHRYIELLEDMVANPRRPLSEGRFSSSPALAGPVTTSIGHRQACGAADEVAPEQRLLALWKEYDAEPHTPERLTAVGREMLAWLRPPASDEGALSGSEQSADRDRMALDLASTAGRLRGELPPLELPVRRPRPAVLVHEAQRAEFELPVSLDLAGLAQREGASIEQVLLAGFLALLWRYSGQDVLVLGTQHRRLGEAGVRSSSPPSPLVLRLRAGPEQRFRELLRSAAAELTEARRHPLARLDDVMRLLNPPKDASRPAPFGVLFDFMDDPNEARGRDGVGSDLDVSRAKYDLALSLHRRRDGIHGQLVYNGLLFDAPQMALLAEHFVRLLVQAVREPEAALGDFDPLTAEERRVQIGEWNQTGAAFSDTSLPALLREQARVRPQATALSCGARRVSYGELLERTERLARGLVARGVRPGEFVALSLRRGIAQVEAILGVLAAGAAYLPIDPEAPQDRVAFILSDTKARRVIVAGDEERLRPALGGLPIEALVLDALAEPGGAPESVELPEIDAAAPAYCLYTSGTSGKPKGVVVTHRNVIRLVRNERFPYEFGPDDVWPLFHSYFFDVSVWEIFCCFAYGGRLVIVDDGVARDGQRFWQLLQSEHVTVLNQTPSAFGHLLRVEELDPAPLEHLRYVIFAGEKLQPRMLTDWFARRPWVKYINMYGITETTVHSTVRFVTREDVAGDISNVGVPLPTTTLYLLDPHRRKHLLPVGVVGEIHVGGLGVTAGYLDRPELNAERFVPDPFMGGRMFRSGDLARYRVDGTLEVIGRRDFQVKLRGYRIELGEIESCLREHAAVAEAVVSLEGGTEGKLVATLRLRGTAPTAVELRAHLARALPEYMIPADFRAVDRMPLTSNGKVDRRALASLGAPLQGRRSAPLETPTEHALAAIWGELLGVDGIGADDSFFERGGHSLLGMRLLVCVADRFGVELPLRSVFEFSRLRELAAAIDRRQEQRHASSSPKSGLRRLHAGGELPPSSFQERVWLAERLDPGTSLYHVPLAWRIEGHLDADVLARALALLVERHEILRTRFIEQDGRLRQQVSAPWTPEVEQVDLQDVAASEREAALHAWMHRAAHQPFDRSSGRLLRSALLSLDGRTQVLFFCLHHLVWDGASAPVFLRELERCYAAASSAGEVALPAPSVQYRDFVDAQSRERASEAGAAGVAYWVEQLKGAPAFLAFPPSPRGEPDGAIPIPLSGEALARLRHLSEARGASSFMVLATALAAVLHRYTGQDDVVFGCPVANREGRNFSEVLGPCVNTVALRSLADAETTLGGLLRATKQAVLGALEHQDAPFEDVVTQLNPPRRSNVTPYIDVTLSLEVVPSVRSSVGGFELAPVAFDYRGTEYGTKFGLTVAFVESEGGLDGTLLYKGDRFGAEDVRQMARLLARVQERFADWIDVPLASLPLDDDAERARLIRFERGEEPGAVATVPGLFARRCAEQPGCPAVESSRGVRSYAALDARADALALKLEPLVAREEPVVALLLPRGEDLIVAMLAAWKAGCSFCPIDPGYPLARIEFILDDLGACAILTDDEALRARFAERSAPVVGVADVVGHERDCPPARAAVLPDPDATAYILYTSGTTGEPKGVMVSHQSLAQLVRWHVEAFAVTPSDRASQIASVGFDATQWEIWPYLCAGACVLPHERAIVVDELAQWLVERRATIGFIPTPLAETLWNMDLPLPALRWMLIGGDALTRTPPRGLPYRVCNNYGLTESTVVATYHPLDPAAEDSIRCIGRPIAGTRVLVLDAARRRCPVGVVGEIYIAGAGVAKGYWRRPELTDSRFLTAGLEDEGGTLYRTGDKGRWVADGTLEFFGRADRQLKIRGYRIEPQEIEAHLRDDPHVQQAAVRGFSGNGFSGNGAASLVAYLVARPEGAATAEDRPAPVGSSSITRAVLARLAARLPAFMVPDAVVWLDELPMTRHGKVDFARLPRPTHDDRVGMGRRVTPTSAIERRIAAIWSEALGVEDVGIHDNFFDLGGNSLLLGTLHARLRNELGSSLPMHALFEFPTVSALAGALAASASAGAPAGDVVRSGALRERAARARSARSTRQGRRS